jgi:hypothetical protein
MKPMQSLEMIGEPFGKRYFCLILFFHVGIEIGSFSGRIRFSAGTVLALRTTGISGMNRLRTFFTALLISATLTLGSPVILAQSATSPWEPVAEGIDYQKFKLPDPNNIYVARMDRDNLNVAIESSIAQGRLSGGFEPVSGMAERYDQALNYWGESWGSRNDVVVAINGFFYNTSTGVPRSGQIQTGWYAKRFDDYTGESGFAWRLDRTPFIGGCVIHPENKQTLSVPALGKTLWIDNINTERGTNQLILYTPQFDTNTRTDNSGLEILVELTRPSLIIPGPNYYAKGFVREIRNNQGSTLIPFDHVVLSAHGSKADKLSSIHIGDEIRISQEITHYKQDCSTPNSLSWTKTYASIGGSFVFLKDSQIIHYNDLGALERHPRTAIAYNDDYIFFIVVDGRDPENSIGMTIDELALFTRDTLGATWGINQDGGGSSTMVINGVVVNRPNANLYEQKIYFPSSSPPDAVMKKFEASPKLLPLAGGGFERYVANGMLMVVVQPMEQSSKYYPDDLIITTAYTNVRLGPGTNYGVITVAPDYSVGVILDHMNGLNGVLAKGYHWWKVSINGVQGWIAEEYTEPFVIP